MPDFFFNVGQFCNSTYCPASQAMVLAHLKGWQRDGRINGEEYGRGSLN